MNGWDALSSIIGGIALVVLILVLFAGDDVAKIIRTIKEKAGPKEL